MQNQLILLVKSNSQINEGIAPSGYSFVSQTNSIKLFKMFELLTWLYSLTLDPEILNRRPLILHTNFFNKCNFPINF